MLLRTLPLGQPLWESIGIPVQSYTVDLPGLCQVPLFAVSPIPKIVILGLPRPWTPLPYPGVPNVDTASLLAALGVGCRTVKAPVPQLVTEAAVPP
jgi:hypothetical protein